MTKWMKASAVAYALLRDVEAWRAKSYPDSAGYITVGYGHVLPKGMLSAEITKELGEQWLEEDVEKVERCIIDTVKVPLTQNQYDALVSFIYNIGVNAWTVSDTLKILNAGHYSKIPDRLRMWNKVTDPATGSKVVSNGLKNRREREVSLWQGV